MDPSHEDALKLFLRLETQWRVGLSGLVGLDYNVAYSMMDRMGLSGERQDELITQLSFIEAGYLEARREK